MQYGRRLDIDRKDVWDVKWSSDDDEMIAVMEKMKMVVFSHEVCILYSVVFHEWHASCISCFHTLSRAPLTLFLQHLPPSNPQTAEEPVVASTYLAKFNDLQVTAVALDR